MSSIPLDVLMTIEEGRPELADLIHEIVATDDEASARVLEKRLADAYFRGRPTLTPEEALALAACSQGRRYGEIDRSQLH